MPTVAQVKYLRELTGNGAMEVKAALVKAGDDPWLAMGFLHVKGVAVAVRTRLPDGTSRPATREEVDAHWAKVARTYANKYHRERPGLAEDIAQLEQEASDKPDSSLKLKINTNPMDGEMPQEDHNGYASPEDVIRNFRGQVLFPATDRLISHLESIRRERQYHVHLHCLPDGTYDIARENDDHSIMEPYAVAEYSCGCWAAGPTMGAEVEMTEEDVEDPTWFTEQHIETRARELQDADATMADAMDMKTYPWDQLTDKAQQSFRDKARAELAGMTPIDITRPLRMRDGTPVENPRLSDNGMSIVVDIPAWGYSASWCIDGKVDPEGPEVSIDLVNDEFAPSMPSCDM